jgi:acyl dehydratase
MTVERKQVGPNRYRESFGRYLEDFKVGDVYEHRPGRTISEADNTWFTLLTMNNHPLHFDAAYCAKTEFGRPLVNSCLTLAITAPVFAGDTIYAESEVLEVRESKSRSTQGVVTVRTTGKKADGTVFMTYERSILVPKRGHAVDDVANY